MSFPALAVTVPLRFAPQWAVPRLSIYRGEPLILLDTEDFAFFAAVGLLWYWIGAKVDRLLRRGQCKQRPRAASAALAAAGLLLAAGVGALAAKYATLTDADKPWEEVGPFGLVWSAMLICYFGWRLFDLYKQASVKSEVGA